MNFILPLPPTVNHTYSTNRGQWYKNDVARIWEHMAKNIIYQQCHEEKFKNNEEVELIVDFFCRWPRDIDGGIKILMDVMAKAKIYENDRQVKSLIVTMKQDKKYPRCEAEVRKI